MGCKIRFKKKKQKKNNNNKQRTLFISYYINHGEEARTHRDGRRFLAWILAMVLLVGLSMMSMSRPGPRVPPAARGRPWTSTSVRRHTSLTLHNPPSHAFVWKSIFQCSPLTFCVSICQLHGRLVGSLKSLILHNPHNDAFVWKSIFQWSPIILCVSICQLQTRLAGSLKSSIGNLR